VLTGTGFASNEVTGQGGWRDRLAATTMPLEALQAASRRLRQRGGRRVTTLCGYSGIQIEVRKAGIECRHW
jgi:hypothetical protein